MKTQRRLFILTSFLWFTSHFLHFSAFLRLCVFQNWPVNHKKDASKDAKTAKWLENEKKDAKMKRRLCVFNLLNHAYYSHLNIISAKSVANTICSRGIHGCAYKFSCQSNHWRLRYKRFSESHLYGSPCSTAAYILVCRMKILYNNSYCSKNPKCYFK